MSLTVVDSVPGLQIGQAETSQHVAAPDGEQPEVDHVEEKLVASREGRDQKTDRNDQELEAPDHESTLAVLVLLGQAAGGAAPDGTVLRPLGRGALSVGT